MNDPLKIQLQIATQRRITTGGGDTDYHAGFVSWHNKTRKHMVVHGTGGFDPIGTSALLTHHVSKWSPNVRVYDPLLFIERFSRIDPSVTSLIYVYDLKQLGELVPSDVTKFFSYLRYALMCNVRIITAVSCDLTTPDLDALVINKRVSSKLNAAFNDHRFFSTLEIK